MTFYQKKPEIVDALQWNPADTENFIDWVSMHDGWKAEDLPSYHDNSRLLVQKVGDKKNFIILHRGEFLVFKYGEQPERKAEWNFNAEYEILGGERK
jgi:hypothetical protein